MSIYNCLESDISSAPFHPIMYHISIHYLVYLMHINNDGSYSLDNLLIIAMNLPCSMNNCLRVLCLFCGSG